MKFLKFNIACRTCMTMDEVAIVFTIGRGYECFLRNGAPKSEYEISVEAQDFLTEIDISCKYCGSSNTEMMNIEFDGKSPVVDPEAKEFQLSIFTDKNGEIAISTGGHTYLPKGFASEAVELIESAINRFAPSKFQKRDRGHFKTTVSTKYVGDALDRENRLEKISFAGFSREDVIRYIGIVKNNIVPSR